MPIVTLSVFSSNRFVRLERLPGVTVEYTGGGGIPSDDGPRLYGPMPYRRIIIGSIPDGAAGCAGPGKGMAMAVGVNCALWVGTGTLCSVLTDFTKKQWGDLRK